MSITKFKTFKDLKNSKSVKKTDNNIDIIKELDNMREVLSKTKRKPTENEMIS